MEKGREKERKCLLVCEVIIELHHFLLTVEINLFLEASVAGLGGSEGGQGALERSRQRKMEEDRMCLHGRTSAGVGKGKSQGVPLWKSFRSFPNTPPPPFIESCRCLLPLKILQVPLAPSLQEILQVSVS